MSFATVFSRALMGLHAPLVQVEADLANGIPSFSIVGLAGTEVKEARDRVRAAIQHCGAEFPQRRITVNLAPADLPKESGRLDLAIAIAILAAAGSIPKRNLHTYEFVGELSLSGELRPIRGALALALGRRRDASASATRRLILPDESAQEAGLVGHENLLTAKNLAEVCAHLNGTQDLPVVQPYQPVAKLGNRPDLADVQGQVEARQALEIAAAGRHSLLMIGPPGSGKSMLASRMVSILPPMTDDDAADSAAMQSLHGDFDPDLWATPPLRSPHHSSSAAALIGGGSHPRPGELSLATGGVLFLDELPEWQRSTLEMLREPLETGQINIARAARTVTFPARAQLVAAMNPCPCGWLGHPQRHCRCTPDAVVRYRSKLSGPLLDRLDLVIELSPVDADTLRRRPDGESSTQVAARVQAAARRQFERQNAYNGQLPTPSLQAHCQLDDACDRLIRKAIDHMKLSARAYHRVLKLARTIADLAARDSITATDLAQAINYRRVLDSF